MLATIGTATLIMLAPLVLASSEPTSGDIISSDIVPTEDQTVINLETYTAEELIIYFSAKYGADANLAYRIAQCEGGVDELGMLRTDSKNPNSSAEGTFQFINSTWYWVMEELGYPTTTPKIDRVKGIEAGMWLLVHGGVGHWEESKYCWNKK